MLKTDNVDWAIDDDNKLIIPIRYTTGPEAVKQGARVRLQQARGEWFLNLRAGLPILANHDAEVTEADAILGQPYNEAKTHAAIRGELLTTPGLARVTSIKTSFDGETRTLRVRWEGVCEWGDTVADTLDLTDPANT